MATINSFEELEIWKNARELSKLIHQFVKLEPFKHDYSFVKQIRSSSGSVMDNIAEGFERGGRKEFVQFLVISKGSCGEVRSQLYRAKDQEYITTEEFDSAMALCIGISKMTQRLIEYLNKTIIEGPRYKTVEEDPIEYLSIETLNLKH